MKTPTRAPDFADVNDSTPAIPAMKATTNDHRSGRQMNPVKGRGDVSTDASIHPNAAATRQATVVTTMAPANPTARVTNDWRSRL